MKLPDIKFTPAQELVLQGVFSLAGTAVVAAIAAVYQYYGQHQDVNIGMLINYALLTFLALFFTALKNYVPAHAQQIIAALQDSEQQAHDALQQALDHISNTAQPVVMQAVPAPSQAEQQQVSQTAVTQPSLTSTQQADPLADPLPVHLAALTSANYTTGSLPAIAPTAAATPATSTPAAPASDNYTGDTLTHVQVAALQKQTQQQ